MCAAVGSFYLKEPGRFGRHSEGQVLLFSIALYVLLGHCFYFKVSSLIVNKVVLANHLLVLLGIHPTH